VGSAFKPFVYAAALASGRRLSDLVRDEPLSVRLPDGRTWEPRNFTGGFDGPITARDALVRSKNVATVRLAQDVGLDAVIATARRAGIRRELPALPSLPLGTLDLSPAELAAAYTPFASLGERAEPRLLLRVATPEGEVLWRAVAPRRRRVLSSAVAYIVTDALAEALERGSATGVRAAGYRGPGAGKTGTTNDGTDAWFVGYTPELVAAVWIGFDQPRQIAPGASGGRLAAPVWGRLMRRLYADHPPPRWRAPQNVVARQADPTTGLLLEPGCVPLRGEGYRELYVRGTEPDATCPRREQGRLWMLLARIWRQVSGAADR
jgi:penicillin-binding protein 1A